MFVRLRPKSECPVNFSKYPNIKTPSKYFRWELPRHMRSVDKTGPIVDCICANVPNNGWDSGRWVVGTSRTNLNIMWCHLIGQRERLLPLRIHISTETRIVPPLSVINMWRVLVVGNAGHAASSSQSSILVHNLCRTVCKLPLCYLQANAAVLLNFALKTQALQFTVQVVLIILFQFCSFSSCRPCVLLLYRMLSSSPKPVT
jgi:hypothetical protein